MVAEKTGEVVEEMKESPSEDVIALDDVEVAEQESMAWDEPAEDEQNLLELEEKKQEEK